MARKRLTEIFPFLLPLRKWQRKKCFYMKMKMDGNIYAKEQRSERLTYEVFKTDTIMVNEHSGYDIQYQYNKVHNLKVAARKLDGVVIKPGETFSIYMAIRDADRHIPYKDGLLLTDGEITGSYGGGLCQMSNTLYWTFLHSPLTVTERHGHNIESLPPTEEPEVIGIDATISEGWLDLKARNDTDEEYQIALDFDDTRMYCSMRAGKPAAYEYKIYNPNVEYFHKKERRFCRAEVNRRKREIDTGKVQEEYLYQNLCEIGYSLDEERQDEQEIIEKQGKNT